jgi:hypothetical protein
VMRGGYPVGVCGPFVYFRGNSMRVPWHTYLPRPAYPMANISSYLSLRFSTVYPRPPSRS